MPYNIPQLRRNIFNQFGQQPNPEEFSGFAANMPPMSLMQQDPTMEGFASGMRPPEMGGLPPQMNIGSQSSFSPPPVEPAPEMGIGGGKPTLNFQDLMRQIGDMETPRQDEYQALLSARPERKSPGILRNIVAAGMGLNSRDPLKTQEDVMYGPYNRELADWQSQLEPQARAAQLENTANANERSLRGSALTYQLGQERIDQTERYNKDRIRIQDEKNTIAKTRADAYDFKMRNPDWKFDTDGPEIIAMNPATKEIVKLGPSGHLSDADEINLRSERKKEEIRLETEGDIRTKQTPSAGKTGDTDTRKAISDHLYQRSLTADKDTAFWIVPPDSGTGYWTLKEPLPESNWAGFKNEENIRKNKIRQQLQNELLLVGSPLQGGQITYPDGTTGNTSQYPGLDPNSKYPGLAAGVTPKYAQNNKSVVFNQSSSPTPPTQPPPPNQTPPTGITTGPMPGPERYQGRPEYGGKSPGGTTVPWWKQILENDTPQTPGGVYRKQIMTPDGPVTVPPGETAMINLETNEIGSIPDDKVAAAEASLKYKRAK